MRSTTCDHSNVPPAECCIACKLQVRMNFLWVLYLSFNGSSCTLGYWRSSSVFLATHHLLCAISCLLNTYRSPIKTQVFNKFWEKYHPNAYRIPSDHFRSSWICSRFLFRSSAFFLWICIYIRFQELLFSMERTFACANPSVYHDRSLSITPLFFSEIAAVSLLNHLNPSECLVYRFVWHFTILHCYRQVRLNIAVHKIFYFGW